MSNIKITALTNIGANIAYTTLVPVVNMAGTPETQKSNVQNLGNLILSGAGGSYFAAAAQAVLAQTVSNAAQPNITSVGSLSSLTVVGNVAAGNISTAGNLAASNMSTAGNLTAGSNNFVVTTTSVTVNDDLTVTGNISLQDTLTSNTYIVAPYIKTNAVVLSALPAASTAGAGARAFITDGNLAAASNFAAAVSGGGSNNVPVYSDGTNWLIG